MTRTRWYALTIMVAALGLAAIVWGRVPGEQATTALPPAPAVGHPAPDFTLPALGGGDLALADLAGQPVVLNFWASWCGPCRAEMPELQRLHDRLGAAGVAVVGVNQGETPETAAAFLQSLNLSFPVALDQRTWSTRCQRPSSSTATASSAAPSSALCPMRCWPKTCARSTHRGLLCFQRFPSAPCGCKPTA